MWSIEKYKRIFVYYWIYYRLYMVNSTFKYSFPKKWSCWIKCVSRITFATWTESVHLVMGSGWNIWVRNAATQFCRQTNNRPKKVLRFHYVNGICGKFLSILIMKHIYGYHTVIQSCFLQSQNGSSLKMSITLIRWRINNLLWTFHCYLKFCW